MQTATLIRIVDLANHAVVRVEVSVSKAFCTYKHI